MKEKKSGTVQAKMLFVPKDEDKICKREKIVQKNVSGYLHLVLGHRKK
jgi:hypothetical protein